MGSLTQQPKAFGRRSRLSTLLVVGTVGLLAAIACVDPRGRYDEYLDYTADARGGGVQDALVVDASVPDGGFNGTYILACVPHALPKDILKFVGPITYVPNTDGTGTITTALVPLRAGATDVSDTVQPALPVVSSPVRADTTFDLVNGAVTLPGAANPVGPQDVVFSDNTVRGRLLSTTNFCGGLDATVQKPIFITLDAQHDFCIFVALPGPTGPVPAVTSDLTAFHCP